MKKIIFFLMTLLIFACNKNDNIQIAKNNGKKFPVNFSVSSFSQSISDFNNRKLSAQSIIPIDSLKNILSAIGCLIVQQNAPDNPIKKYIFQLSSTTNNFGVITDSLPYGQYTAYFSAVGLTANLENSVYTTTHGPGIFDLLPSLNFVIQVGTSAYAISNSDAFIADSVNFNVDGVTNNQNVGVSFKRIPGLLKLNIEDDNDGFNLKAYVVTGDIACKYNFYTDQIDPPEVIGDNFPSYYTYLNKISTGNYEIYQPYAGHPFTIHVDQYSSDGQTVVRSKTIDNVVCERNQITTLSGRFGDSSITSDMTSSFAIHIDTTWGTDTTKIRF